MNAINWTPQQIRDALADNSFTYQNVPLPFGIETGGKDRSTTAKQIFPDDLTSKSVLDVGCMYGYFCFAAEDRGASGCMGVDIDPDNVAKSSLLGEMRGSTAKFQQLDIEADGVPGKFDYVLCLNVLHHLRNPLAVIDKLAAAARDSLILEIASFAPRDRKKNGVSWLAGKLLSQYPIMFVAGASSQTFFVTAKAMRRLLLEHRFDFASAKALHEGHKGRFIVVAKRRRIKRLLVVAGLPASGKSTFVDAMTSGQADSLVREMGLDTKINWSKWLFGKFLRSDQQDFEDMILHYNICKHVIDGDLYHYSRVLTDLMAVAREVIVVTVGCPRQELYDRFKATRIQNTRKSMFSARRRKKIARLVDLYERPSGLEALYLEWINFLKSRQVRNFIVAPGNNGYRLCNPDELIRDELAPARQ